MRQKTMDLGLSTYWGSPHHWDRLISFARERAVDRLVYAPYPTQPWLYPQYPSLLSEDEKSPRQIVRNNFASAAQKTHAAGMEFWLYYTVLVLPAAHMWESVEPGLFGPDGEPDMSNTKLYNLLNYQLDEALSIAPTLAGIELWIEEGASIPVTRLKSQSMPIKEFVRRIVETVHAKCRQNGLQLDIDLHVGGGERRSVEALLAVARDHSDIVVSADNTTGDFHLHLPFNSHLWRASVTNPTQVHFDVNGEYWGRNMYPTSGLAQTRSHLNEARALGASCVNGRVMAALDGSVPYANVLPSRRHLYPALMGLRQTDKIPTDLQIFCGDTLGGYNAEFFCRYAKDPTTKPRDVVCEFLQAEFGRPLPELADVLLDTESAAAQIFYTDQNYFGAQSMLPPKWVADFFANDVQFTVAAGDMLPLPLNGNHAEWASVDYFIGTPIPTGRSVGPHSLIEEKRCGLRCARDLLARADKATERLSPEPREFVLGHFRDMVSFAEAASVLLEAMVHYYHLLSGRQNQDIPNIGHLFILLGTMTELADAWEIRQPHDEWHTARTLRDWRDRMADAIGASSP